MYIDESGDTIELSRGGKQFLVLTGCIIHESDRVAVEQALRGIKHEFYQNSDVEIKSNFLRYANPDLNESSPLKLHDRDRYNALEDKVTAFLMGLPATLIAIVIAKADFWRRYPSKNPYNTAYQFLIERFQHFLESAGDLGIAILDPRGRTGHQALHRSRDRRCPSHAPV